MCIRDSNDTDLMASTLEGCLVRISDVIAYLGKDRQDADKLRQVGLGDYDDNPLGKYNHEIIGNISADIINNSIGKNYIAMSDKTYADLSLLMDENYRKIYRNSEIDGYTDEDLQNIINDVFEALYNDLKQDKKLVNKYYRPYIYPNAEKVDEYFAENIDFPERVAIDAIAIMSDKYL